MKKISIVIIIILIGIIFFMRECQPTPPTPDPIIVTVRDTIRDTISKEITRYIPKISYQDTGSIQWKYLTTNIDTTAILKDYFSAMFYQDTIINDSTVFIVVMDTIYMNRIKSRQIAYKVYQTSISEVTTITQPEKLRNKIFIGIGTGGSPTSFGMDLSFMLLNKKENAYTLSYDVLNKDIRFTMYWKIRF